MDFKQAVSRNLSLKTEIGAGGRVASGLFNRRVFNRRNFRLDGGSSQDVIHERQLRIGPICVTHRSRNPSLFSGDPHEIGVSLFQIIGVYSNDRDFLIKAKAGVNAGVLRTALGLTPARALAQAVDLDVLARAGFRLNVSRLISDLQRDDEREPVLEDANGEDLDFS